MLHFSSAPPLWTILPFVGILLSIALFPLFAHGFWEKNRNRALVSLAWCLPTLWYFRSDLSVFSHSIQEYLSFICYLISLYVISGGIAVTGDLRAKPTTNLAFLGLGALLANLIGTTGASMLLVRPFLKTNRQRKKTWHLPLFFIFIVSNIGGLLTPLGDPPLFLGFLNGVPFTWTLSLFPHWIIFITLLLLIFWIWEKRAYGLERPADLQLDREIYEPLRIEGSYNFLFLVGIMGSIFLPLPWRELGMILLTTLSFVLTPRELHRKNQFGFHPVIEVAILFAGIFITMVPALIFLEMRGSELHLTEPWHFFWVTGLLSSFLDNAPTYLTFFNLAKGLHLGGGIAGVPERILEAISLGAVFMGANSYIGNGPNFMVKAIADEQGFKTLNFGAYLLVSLMILGPLYLLITFLFLL